MNQLLNTLLLLTLLCALSTHVFCYNVTWEANFNLPKQDSNGWSIFVPSEDSRLIYVSASSGNDTSAKYYFANDTLIGSDPFQPAYLSSIRAFKTIDAAQAQQRAGFPDYVLLKRGDTWLYTSGVATKAGRSVDERSVFGAYGSNTDTDRPLIKTGTAGGVSFHKGMYGAIVGIKFLAHSRDPSSPDFVGFNATGTPSGFGALNGYANYYFKGRIIIEDCWFDWYAVNLIQNDDVYSNYTLRSETVDVIIRRNLITNNYAYNSHSQGFFTSHLSILVEENVFDHNGWYKTGLMAEGGATMYNHNIYFAAAYNTIIRNNFFLRGSSMGTKFTSNSEPAELVNQLHSYNILVENNFYLEGEIGISMGGNDNLNNGPRWKNMLIVNNVFNKIGVTRPTQRSLAWGIEMYDWLGGLVSGNLFCNYGSPDGTIDGSYAISVSGYSSSIQFQNNVAYNVSGGSSYPVIVLQSVYNEKCGFSFIQNQVQQPKGAKAYLMKYNLGYRTNSIGTFKENTYYYDYKGASQAFLINNTLPFSSMSTFTTIANDVSSNYTKINYTNPNYSIEAYMASLGFEGSVDSFVNELKKQSKTNWRKTFTASVINSLFRKAFDMNVTDIYNDIIVTPTVSSSSGRGAKNPTTSNSTRVVSEGQLVNVNWSFFAIVFIISIICSVFV